MKPKYLEIERTRDLTEDRFIRDYLTQARPVVIENAMDQWPALQRWTFDAFSSRFGEMNVDLQGSDFDEIDRMKFSDYLKQLDKWEALDIQESCQRDDVPYLRYSGFQNGPNDKDLSQLVVDQLSEDWEKPAFLPSSLYVHPPVPAAFDPTVTRYPDFGIYISPKGARTALHIDAGMDDNVLCQLQGEKRCFLISPAEARHLDPDHKLKPTVDPKPTFPNVTEIWETRLCRGEIIFIPAIWYHEVYTVSKSMSMTFNYVHITRAAEWLERALSRPELVLSKRERITRYLNDAEPIVDRLLDSTFANEISQSQVKDPQALHQNLTDLITGIRKILNDASLS